MSEFIDTLKKIIVTRKVEDHDVAILLDRLIVEHNVEENLTLFTPNEIAGRLPSKSTKMDIINAAVGIFAEHNMKIPAIKFIRTITGCDLNQGKEWVGNNFTWKTNVLSGNDPQLK